MSAYSAPNATLSKPSATGYGRRWAANLDLEGRDLDIFGEVVQQHADFWTSMQPTLDSHLHHLATKVEAFFVRLNAEHTEPQPYKDWARAVDTAFDRQAVNWKKDLSQVNSNVSQKQVDDSHFLPEVSFGLAPGEGKSYTVYIEAVHLQSHWDSPGPRIHVEGTIDLTPAQCLSSSQYICSWPIKIDAVLENGGRSKVDQISYEAGSKSANTASDVNLHDARSHHTAKQGSNEDPPTCLTIDLSGTGSFAMTKESLQGSAPQIFEFEKRSKSWLTGLFR